MGYVTVDRGFEPRSSQTKYYAIKLVFIASPPAKPISTQSCRSLHSLQYLSTPDAKNLGKIRLLKGNLI